MIEIALYQPDIAPNAATIARLCACFGIRLTIIEPAGFVWTDAAFRRAGMDYLQHIDIQRSACWEKFLADAHSRRIILLSTKATTTHVEFRFKSDDILLLGRESAGVPVHVHEALPHRVRVPMVLNMRSLNVAITAGIVAAEALRQLGHFG